MPKRPRSASGSRSGSGSGEESGEDLFGDDFMRDYEGNSEGTASDSARDSFVNDMSSSEGEDDAALRAEVDDLLDRRRRLERMMEEEDAARAVDDPMEDMDDASLVDEEPRDAPAAEQEVFGDHELEADFDWAHPPGDNVAEWLQQDAPCRVIKNRLYHFLANFREGAAQRPVYQERIHLMARDNAQSFEVSYVHLGRVYGAKLALWVGDHPDAMLPLLDEAATHLVYHRLYPQYAAVHKRIQVRIADVPVCDPIRDFRQVHRDVLTRVEGVVIRRSPVYPQLQAVRYNCGRCSYIIGPVMQRGTREVKVSQCPSCHSHGPFRVNMALTEFRNHQTLVLQEPPSNVPPGRLPRSLEVVLTGDIIDRAKPGEHVDVTGVYKNNFDAVLNHRQGFPIFTTLLLANNIHRRTTDSGAFRVPEEERQKIVALARHPKLKQKLIQSVAPSIHGREDIKLGLLLALLSGVPKHAGDGHNIRGDINVLLVGDPGTAKSQCLKFVEKTADRAVFTTGRGSTAVGLTASVQRDPVTNDFVLEGGALVIADRGVCLIDEFDKMSDQDRTSIHEAMEQQTISVARAGIVTTLSARCSVISAANPIGGRYDPSVSFESNVDLTPPILSRFDLLFVIRDEVNPDADEALARFVCGSHGRSHPAALAESKERTQHLQQRLLELAAQIEAGTAGEETGEELAAVQEELATGHLVREDEDPNSARPLSQQLLKRYILYAKSHCRPLLVNVEVDTITALYRELRQESKHGGIPITVRHMESIIRLAEAHAKLHLREYVENQDVSAAVALFLRCFLGTQKYSTRQALENKFRKYMESDVEPLQLLHNRLGYLVQRARLFERRFGAVEPTTVSVEAADVDAEAAGIKVSSEALMQYYGSSLFRDKYALVLDANGLPLRVEHTLL